MRPTVQEYQRGRVVAGLTFLVIGFAFLLESYHVWRVRPVDVWPLFLIAFGTAVMLGRFKRIKVEEDRTAQLAVAEERVRIARELHDIVAHGVSLMTIQIAAARRVQRAQPEAAEQSLQAAEETGRQSLAQLQGMLNMLRGADASIEAASIGAAGVGGSGAGAWRGDLQTSPPPAVDANPWKWPPPPTERNPLPRLADLDGLVAGLRKAGLDLTTTIVGTPPALSPGVELAVYRVIQEALTNAMRYAPQAHVQLEVTYAPDHVVLFVDDDGAHGASPARAAHAGHGIVGMRERVSAVGGTLYAGPRQPGPGWRVHARIPVLSGMTSGMT
jgi:signal transduction histidine kinase